MKELVAKVLGSRRKAKKTTLKRVSDTLVRAGITISLWQNFDDLTIPECWFGAGLSDGHLTNFGMIDPNRPDISPVVADLIIWDERRGEWWNVTLHHGMPRGWDLDDVRL